MMQMRELTASDKAVLWSKYQKAMVRDGDGQKKEYVDATSVRVPWEGLRQRRNSDACFEWEAYQVACSTIINF